MLCRSNIGGILAIIESKIVGVCLIGIGKNQVESFGGLLSKDVEGSGLHSWASNIRKKLGGESGRLGPCAR